MEAKLRVKDESITTCVSTLTNYRHCILIKSQKTLLATTMDKTIKAIGIATKTAVDTMATTGEITSQEEEIKVATPTTVIKTMATTTVNEFSQLIPVLYWDMAITPGASVNLINITTQPKENKITTIKITKEIEIITKIANQIQLRPTIPTLMLQQLKEILKELS